MVSANGGSPVPRKGPGREGPAKVEDLEYLFCVCLCLKGLSLRCIEIQQVAWVIFKGRRSKWKGKERRVKWEGVGGAIRRLLQQHCSTFAAYKGTDLFTHKD